jgi:glutathione S-transferase
MDAPLPILYSFRRCPYAMRARMALFSAGIPCRLREVVLRDKPAEMLEASPKGTVPVLVLPGGKVVEESFDVMRWALEQRDPEGLMALSPGEREEAEALIAETEEEFKPNLDRYKYANRYEGAEPEEHREAGLAFLQRLEARLGDEPFLFGTKKSYADIAIAPFVRQFAFVDKAWFDEQSLPGVQRWLENFLSSALFAAVMKKYPQWKNGDPEPLFPPEDRA